MTTRTLVLVGGGILVLASMAGCTLPATQQSTGGQARDFYVLNGELDVNESAGIPGDYFVPSVLAVQRGDNVTIHFYNTEDVDEGANHTFTLEAYNISLVVAPHGWGNATFVAGRAGVFDFYCEFHQPTMRGQLVVQG